MQVLEIGSSARAALDAASRLDVLMTFSRGQVLQTDHGDIVWLDFDYEAFSPCGVRIPAPARSAAVVRDGLADDSFGQAIDDAVSGACATFVEAVRGGSTVAGTAGLLLGLGRGLTPAGDDFLGGFLVVRHRRGRPETFDTSATHIISAARLAMHMRGEGTRAEMRFVDALISGGDLESAAATLRRFGQSSGQDFMLGARAAADLR